MLQIAAKSGNSVTLGKLPGGTAPAGSSDVDGHPKHLAIDSAVLTTHISPFDSTFFGCGATFRLEITRMT